MKLVDNFLKTFIEYNNKKLSTDDNLYNKKLIFKDGTNTNFKHIEEAREKQEKIYDYYFNQYFNKSDTDQISIFLTYTINKKFNNTKHITQEKTRIKRIKKQNEAIQKELKYFNTILSNNKIKTNYILVKELTKKFNIHLHQLVKINKSDYIRFIELLKNLHNRNVLTRIEIIANQKKYPKSK